jgi:diadenosine tetraphosphate (Ap4A) HIT family hydrolase
MMPNEISIGFLDGLTSPQAVAHAIVHIVPRHRGDGLALPDNLEWITVRLQM